jgi:hypothetical protein
MCIAKFNKSTKTFFIFNPSNDIFSFSNSMLCSLKYLMTLILTMIYCIIENFVFATDIFCAHVMACINIRTCVNVIEFIKSYDSLWGNFWMLIFLVGHYIVNKTKTRLLAIYLNFDLTCNIYFRNFVDLLHFILLLICDYKYLIILINIGLN